MTEAKAKALGAVQAEEPDSRLTAGATRLVSLMRRANLGPPSAPAGPSSGAFFCLTAASVEPRSEGQFKPTAGGGFDGWRRGQQGGRREEHEKGELAERPRRPESASDMPGRWPRQTRSRRVRARRRESRAAAHGNAPARLREAHAPAGAPPTGGSEVHAVLVSRDLVPVLPARGVEELNPVRVGDDVDPLPPLAVLLPRLVTQPA